ncbi:hypothetical protein BDZ45DRAFT_749461 [Acephala macrosclerotiorum]|nr:hypothetical protein BDZ45DRAFT_749461 [Acephala macrosclerotiorum]
MRFAAFTFSLCCILTAVIAAPAPIKLDSPAGILCSGLTCYNYLKSIISIIPRNPQVTSPWYYPRR